MGRPEKIQVGGGAVVDAVSMNRKMVSYLISESELEQLALPDRMTRVVDAATALSGAAGTAALALGLEQRGWAAVMAAVLSLFAGVVASKAKPPKHQHQAVIDRIKLDSYDGSVAPRPQAGPLEPLRGTGRSRSAGG